jgi:predicted ester cyclase
MSDQGIPLCDIHQRNKAVIAPMRRAMVDFDETGVRAILDQVCSLRAVFRLCYPFGEMSGSQEFCDRAFVPLFAAIPDLERRDTIVIAGTTPEGENWVGCCGYYTGTLAFPWLDIPPTGHQVSMRFHEFFRLVDDKVVEMQALWDIPEVMIQANAWPMAPSLGREWHVPGPATQDGIVSGPYDGAEGEKTRQHIIDMLTAMKRHLGEGGPELMEMEKYWHQNMSWYGPSGVGTCRGIEGFRNWHQIPFLNAMPDRGQYLDQVEYHFFAEQNFGAVTGWPNMIQTLTPDGWMGIAPAGKKINMRSLDFWRVENDLIRENRVMVDLLHMYDQLGVDVFGRLREFNKARNYDPAGENMRDSNS